MRTDRKMEGRTDGHTDGKADVTKLIDYVSFLTGLRKSLNWQIL